MPVIRTAEDLGTAIAQRRKMLHLTQSDLAGGLGVTRQLIGELERGKAGIGLEVALMACRELGLVVSAGASDAA